MRGIFYLIIGLLLFASLTYLLASQTNLELTPGHLSVAGDGRVTIETDHTIHFNQTDHQLLIRSDNPIFVGGCAANSCFAEQEGALISIPKAAISMIELHIGSHQLSIGTDPIEKFELTVTQLFEEDGIRLESDGQLSLRGGDINGSLEIESEHLGLFGSIEVRENTKIEATGDLIVHDHEMRQVTLSSGRDLLLAGSQLEMRLLQHRESAIFAGQNITLQSPQPIIADAHLFAQGMVNLQKPNGQAVAMVSPEDPVILAGGDVSLASYTGASLHILAGGSVTVTDITITGADSVANSINNGNSTPFNGTDRLSDLASLLLSDGAAVNVDGSKSPTADIRAGIDWSSFAGGAPTNITLPIFSLFPQHSAATGADIVISGGITVTEPSGMILLTNQYRPTRSTGEVIVGDLLANTTTTQADGGQIIVDSRGDISVGAVDSRAEIPGLGVSVGDGGSIMMLAPNGNIETTGDIMSLARVPVNSSGPAGNGGSITISANGAVNVAGGDGEINASSFANSTGDAGNAGDVHIVSGSLAAKRVYAQSFSGSGGGSAGNGGQVLIETTDGPIVLIDTLPSASIQTGTIDFIGTAGVAGSVTLTASTGITLTGDINVRSSGAESDSGDITVVSETGDIHVEGLIASAVNSATPGNGGEVFVRAENGGIKAAGVESYSNAFVINNPSQNGGPVTLYAGDGDIQTGSIESYSNARGLTGDTGNGAPINLQAINGGITVTGNIRSYALSSLNNSNSSNAGMGGNISIHATHAISVGGNIESYSQSGVFGRLPIAANASDGGEITILSDTGQIAIQDVSSYSSSQSSTGNGGDITIRAISGIDLKNGDGQLLSYTTAFTDTADAGTGGNVSVHTESGDLELSKIETRSNSLFNNNASDGGDILLFTGDGSVRINTQFFAGLDSSSLAGMTAGDAGNITVQATSGITIDGRISANVQGIDGNAGNITLISPSGNISATETINASALYNTVGEPGDGGNIDIQAAAGSVLLTDVWAQSHTLLIHNDAQEGGDISILAGDGDIRFIDLFAFSESRGARGDTGNAGKIELIAVNGGIEGEQIRADALSSINNNGSGIAGNGNEVTLQATGDIELAGGIKTASASLNTSINGPSPSGAANDAGDVDLSGRSISLGYIDARSISTTTIGAGGSVEINANQFFQGSDTLFRLEETIAAVGLSGTGGITITHGGAGLTPFEIGDSTVNGVTGTLRTADAVIVPANTFFTSFFEAPNIWINAIIPPPIITKQILPGPQIGYQDEITYTVVISNRALIDAEAVSLVDTLPIEVDFKRWIEQNGAEVADDSILWDGTVPSESAISISFVVDHIGTYSDVFTNTATFSHPGTESSGNASVIATVDPPPALSIEKNGAPLIDLPLGGTLTYEINLHNSSGTAAHSVTLTDTLPSQVTFSHWLQQDGAIMDGNRLTWTGSVPAYGSITIEFVVEHVGNYGDQISNVVTFNHPDSGSSGSATVEAQVEPPVQLSIAKEVWPKEIAAYRGEIIYAVTLENGGGSDALGVILTDTLPAQVEFGYWTEQNGASLDVENNLIRWNGTVPAANSVSIRFVVKHVGGYEESIINVVDYLHPTSGSSGRATAEVNIEPKPEPEEVTTEGLILFLPVFSKITAPLVCDWQENELALGQNNGLTEAEGPLSACGYTQRVDGELEVDLSEPLGESDWFAIDILEESRVEVSLIGPDGTNFNLTFMYQNGIILPFDPDTGYSGDGSSISYPEKIILSTVPPGRYYLALWGFDGDFHSKGAYQVDVLITPLTIRTILPS